MPKNDHGTIDVRNANALAYASAKWGCTRQDIRDARKATGSSDKEVILTYLKENGVITYSLNSNDMSDDKKKQGYQDDSTINLNEPYEVQYAAKDIRVTPADIRDAAAATGSKSRETIYQWLRDNGRVLEADDQKKEEEE